MTQRRREALQHIAERPGTPAEGDMARERLDPVVIHSRFDLDGFMRDMDLYLLPVVGVVQ